MTRAPPPRPASPLTLAVGGVVLVYVGCSGGRQDPDDATRPSGVPASTDPDAAAEGPAPAAVLVV